ncbi:hypothetical protein K4F52_010329, partial [Lecanicillium sp. MT-2017a]
HKKKHRTAAAATATGAQTQQYRYQYHQQQHQQPVPGSQVNSYSAQGYSYQPYNGQWPTSPGAYGAPQDQHAYQTQQTSPSPGWASADAMPRSPEGSELEARPIPIPELPVDQKGTPTVK